MFHLEVTEVFFLSPSIYLPVDRKKWALERGVWCVSQGKLSVDSSLLFTSSEFFFSDSILG